MTEKSSSEIEIDFISSREALVLVQITGEQIKGLYNILILENSFGNNEEPNY